MTLQELYQKIGGDYEQAIRVLRLDKLIDKHIRKVTSNGVIENVIEAGNEMDPVRLFESSHAMKGVCANLGLTKLAEAASEISEEFRPGKSRHLSDEEVRARIRHIADEYQKVVDGIRKFEES